MLRKVTLKNFKAYGPKGTTFELAPITLILGPNSIGKSTLFQALMALKQTWEDDLAGIRALSCSGRYVQLGRFGNLLHAQAPNSGDATSALSHIDTVELGVEWYQPGRRLVEQRRNEPQSREPTATDTGAPLDGSEDEDVAVPADAGPHTAREPERHEVSLSWSGMVRGEGDGLLGDNALAAVTECGIGPKPVRMTAEQSDEERDSVMLAYGETTAPSGDEPSNAHRIVVRVSSPPSCSAGEGVEPPDSKATVSARARELTALRERILEIEHIGPVRSPGRRLYEKGTLQDSFVGYDGGKFVEVLTSDGLLQIPRVDAVNEALSQVGVDYRLQVEPLKTMCSPSFELRLVSCAPGVPKHTVGLPDVGFGISQILPILTQHAVDTLRTASEHNPDSLPSTRVLLVEQPELHLHPRWQAALAEYFAVSLSRSRGSLAFGEPPQVILETHSELMVRRLLRLIAVGEIQKEDVSLIAVFRTSRGETATRMIRLDDAGEIVTGWPGGFFPEREDDE